MIYGFTFLLLTYVGHENPPSICTQQKNKNDKQIRLSLYNLIEKILPFVILSVFRTTTYILDLMCITIYICYELKSVIKYFLAMQRN